MAYAIFRVTLGLNIFLHGFVRILTGPSAFEAQTEKLFTSTFLPAGQVHFFLSVLPYIEAAVGSLIVVGLFTFWALVAGALLMLVLIFRNRSETGLDDRGNPNGLRALLLLPHLSKSRQLAGDRLPFRKSPSGT